MCLSKYSNQALLKQVAMNLYPSEDNINVNGLCERELAALINTYYQSQCCEVRTSGEKRKNEVDISKDNKKLRVPNKESNIFSALELLPNEVYEMILKPLGDEDQKNLRITSKRLYEKTTLMAPIFKAWSFKASRGIPPDFVSDTKKKFKVHALKTCSMTEPLIKRFASRISSVKIQKEGELLESLNLFISDFKHLTSLYLEFVYFDKSSLLMLAPQLEHLRLDCMNDQFDISSVDEQSKCFTKLKTLHLIDIDIDLKKILSKSCKTLELLKCDNFRQTDGLVDLKEELSSLKSLSINIASEKPIRNLLSKCSGSLITLELTIDRWADIDFNNIVDQTMNITTLVLDPQCNKNNISMLFTKFPLIQNLTLMDYDKKVNNIFHKDLINLNLVYCKAKCVSSILNQTSKSLKTLLMVNANGLTNLEFHEFPNLDTVWIEKVDESLNSDNFLHLFPYGTKVTTEEVEDRTVIRRVYDLS